MAKIPASKVLVRRRYIVDCEVCQEAVEPESGAFATREEAEEAKQRHLDSPGLDEKPHHARVDGTGQVCLVCGRRTTHIRAYVKGPDGAPLKAVPETVYRVAR